MITVKKHLAVMDDGFTTNTYIVTDEETGATAVVDPSLPEESLIEKLSGKDVQYILLTHGHFDHFCGAKLVKEKTGAKVVIHKDDEIMLHDVTKNEFQINCVGYQFPEIDADILTEDGTELMLGNTKITVMHTPGHSMGGVCYLFMEDKVMFSGDTLFKLCAGRADLYGGNGRQELRSLAKISELEGNYKVYPGHEDDTTLDFERENNRYIRTRFRRK
ncbi:MAG: MBL fold metallo-hydrolase [Clostridia bacterium]|nr:MBL fold metallo-hydrolase [Clostridia bacterium]